MMPRNNKGFGRGRNFALPEYSRKMLDELLEKAAPVLGKREFEDLKEAVSMVKIYNMPKFRNFTGAWLEAAIADAGDVPPFNTYGGTPEINPYWHSLIVGMPGTGKTVYGNLMVVRLALKYPELTIVVFDVEGDRAPYIITELERIGLHDRWLYFDETSIRENMFELADVNPLWFTMLSRIFNELGFYGDVGLSHIRQYFMDVNRVGERNRRDGWATFEEAVQYMANAKPPRGSKEEKYRETILERMQGWLPVIGHLFDCRSGYPWESLRGQVIIYDVSRVDGDAQLFFQSFLISKLLFIKDMQR